MVSSKGKGLQKTQFCNLKKARSMKSESQSSTYFHNELTEIDLPCTFNISEVENQEIRGFLTELQKFVKENLLTTCLKSDDLQDVV